VPAGGQGRGRKADDKHSRILEYLNRLSDALFFLARQEKKKLMRNPSLLPIKRFF